MALGGRPKEDGGHIPLKITVDKFCSEALDKISKGKKSKFIEDVLKPVLEQLDPNDSSIFVWKIDAWITKNIQDAAAKGNFKQVQALAYLANKLKDALGDARNLCGTPPSDFNASGSLQAERVTTPSNLKEETAKDLKAMEKAFDQAAFDKRQTDHAFRIFIRLWISSKNNLAKEWIYKSKAVRQLNNEMKAIEGYSPQDKAMTTAPWTARGKRIRELKAKIVREALQHWT